LLVGLIVPFLSARATISAPPSAKNWLPATPEKLPRWRGFNLLEKFTLGGGHKPFLEDDFRMISQLGFNFVRLPMDYRLWIKNGNWEEFDEATLKEIDQAVGWGTYNKTPHDVVLRWAEDCLANWQKANWGWAVWNFRGPFGILDSQRPDVKYESFEGHRLDRKFLDLLQRY
jgi:aryl-phospho-beta-D-glucosidase BglC (GH1 family)